jgi:putative ABC transport system permease protein
MINLADVPATELIQPGSRVSRAVLFAGAPADVAAFREQLKTTKQPGERLQAIEDASPQIVRPPTAQAVSSRWQP